MLLTRLRNAFAAPHFEDDREQAAASLLNAVLWSVILVSAVYQVFQVVAGIDAVRVAAVGTVFLVSAAARVVLQYRRLDLAAWLVISLIFCIACVSIWMAGRLDAPGTTTFVVLIVMSATALDWRPTAFWAALSLAAVSLFAVAAARGLLPPPEPIRPATDLWFIYAAHIVAVGWLVGHSAFAFRGVLGQLGSRSMALKDSEARHAQLVEQSPDVIVALDGDGVVVECSPAMETLFGYPVADVVGRSFRELSVLDPGALQENLDHFAAIVAGQRNELAEAQVLHRDGSLRWVEANPRVVAQADGSQRVYLVIRDTTARHEAEEQRVSLERQLVEARRLEALGRMAGAVAHDFNNLLLVILANAELLESDAGDPPEKLLGEIRIAAEGAAELTGQLLTFAGQQVPEIRRVNVGAAVSKIEGLLRRLMPPNVELEISRSAEHDMARGDPAQLQQVIVNLVMNAQQAMPDGGTVTVEVSSEHVAEGDRSLYAGASPGPHVRLAVSDEGRGMDPLTARRIFEPFFSERPGGTGLGLATVHGIVTRVGGHVRVHSKVGEGTTFEVFLPVASAEEAPVSAKDTAVPLAQEKQGVTVLLVDDDDAILVALGRLLELQGFRVLCAGSSEAATALSREEPGEIHLLVTDVLMPGASGIELAAQLIRERPGLRVLVMSGYTRDDLEREEQPGEGVSFMPKPFTSDVLRDRIWEILGEA